MSVNTSGLGAVQTSAQQDYLMSGSETLVEREQIEENDVMKNVGDGEFDQEARKIISYHENSRPYLDFTSPATMPADLNSRRAAWVSLSRAHAERLSPDAFAASS